uniref:PRA1 family protein n=2 Tax=Ditylum brightwellii TaxID=49249 RepID=A0A7S4QI31_9STRA
MSNSNNTGDIMEMAKAADQANKAAAAVSGAIPEGAKTYIRQAKEKIFDSDKLRPVSVFFGMGEQGAWSISLNPVVLCPRIKNNILFFYLNYILLAALIFFISMLATFLNPKTIILSIGLAAAWFVVLKATAEDKKFGPITITRKNATFLMIILSGVAAFFIMKDVFFITLGSGSGISLIHAIFRDGAKERIEETTSEPQQLEDTEPQQDLEHDFA